MTDQRPAALEQLLRAVARERYRFTVVTPLTHQRVLARPGPSSPNLRDIFGWNLPFTMADLPAPIARALDDAALLRADGGQWRSALRIASLGTDLFLHSSFPTTQDDAVFFGPDTYRFARLIGDTLRGAGMPGAGPCRILDIGCGSGAGGIVAARTLMQRELPYELTLNDINPAALALAAVNAGVAGMAVRLAEGDALSTLEGEYDLIVSNPPYLDDEAGRAYRHGGERLGRSLSVRIAAEAVARLAPGGRLILYTGVAMLGAGDPFLDEVAPILDAARCRWSYEEIDPDVFGEELERPAYRRAERIAVVGLVAVRAAGGDDGH